MSGSSDGRGGWAVQDYFITAYGLKTRTRPWDEENAEKRRQYGPNFGRHDTMLSRCAELNRAETASSAPR
jgi:hypothetical protein